MSRFAIRARATRPRPSGPRAPRPTLPLLLLPLLLAAAAGPARAQTGNILMPVDTVERLLRSEPFEVIDVRPSRGLENERTNRVAMSYGGRMLLAKWAAAPATGGAFNNQPRYEVAAYEIQKLFLPDSSVVVPPTVLRAFPLDWYAETIDRDGEPTLGTRSVIVALQYWLYNVTPDDFWDEDRFRADSVYARHFADFNILTYLIHHNDANEGNFLISTDTLTPRVFSVDNGVSFASERSVRGDDWRRLRVRRLPASTVARLRSLTEQDLIDHLETLAQFRIREDGQLEAVAPMANLDPHEGIRRRGALVQLGLTHDEIEGVWNRLQNLLRDVDRGRILIF